MQSYRLLKDYKTRDHYVLAGTTVYEAHDPFGLAEFEKLVKHVEHRCVTRGAGHREFVVPLSDLEPITEVVAANGERHEPKPTPRVPLGEEPTFTLLGSDNASGQLMAIYALACEARGDAPETVALAKKISADMDDYCRKSGRIPGRFSMKAPTMVRRGLSPEQAADLKTKLNQLKELFADYCDHDADIFSAIQRMDETIDRFAFVPATPEESASTPPMTRALQ